MNKCSFVLQTWLSHHLSAVETIMQAMNLAAKQLYAAPIGSIQQVTITIHHRGPEGFAVRADIHKDIKPLSQA